MRLINSSLSRTEESEDEYAGNVFWIPNPIGKLYRTRIIRDKKSRLAVLYTELHLFDGLMFKTSFGDCNNLYRRSFGQNMMS